MRVVLRNVIFSLISLLAVSNLFSGVYFEGSKSIILVAVGLGAISILSRPILKLMSLPDSGIGYIVLAFLLNLISFYVLDRFLFIFSISKGSLTGLNILGIMISSYELSVFWSYVFVSGLFSLLATFLGWLCTSKKK